MRLEVNRYNLQITSDSGFWTNQDTAFLEDTLGLKKDGDAILLVRKNAMGLSCPAYLETKKVSGLEDKTKTEKLLKIYQKAINEIDDFFEYRYKSAGVDIKQCVMESIGKITIECRKLNAEEK